MNSNLSIALSHHDFTVLKQISKGNLSGSVKQMLQNFDLDQIKERLDTDRTTIRLDLPLAVQLQEAADKLGVTPGRVARAVIEMNLRNHHH